MTAAGAWTYTQAQTPYTWTGAGGNNLWNNAANWAGGAVPGASSDVIFSGTWCSGSACNVSLNATVQVNSLKMSANFPGTITETTAGVTIGNNAGDEAFWIEGGTWTGYSGMGFPGTRRVNGIARFSGGTMTFSEAFSFYSSLYVLGGTYSSTMTLLRGAGTNTLKASIPLPMLEVLNDAGGHVEIDGTVQTTDFLINSQGTCTGSNNKVLGGTVQVSGDLVVQNSCGGTTSFVMTGMNKSILYGSAPAAPGGLLPGSLSIAASTGTHAVTVPAGGYSARIAADLTLAAGATLSMGGNNLAMGGNLILQSGATINLGGGTMTVLGQTTNGGTINP